MNAHYILRRDREEGHRVTLLEVLGCSKRKPFQIIARLDVFRSYTCLIQPVPVERRALVSMVYRPFQALELEIPQFFGCLHGWAKTFAHKDSLLRFIDD
jgi:hypothetical protein